MNSKQATKALNELVSYSPFRRLGAEPQDRDQFDPQDWKDYLYDEAVSFQRKTKSTREIYFPQEIWDIIKSYNAISPEQIAKYLRSKIYDTLTAKTWWNEMGFQRGGGLIKLQVYQDGKRLTPYNGRLRQGMLLWNGTSVFKIEKGSTFLIREEFPWMGDPNIIYESTLETNSGIISRTKYLFTNAKFVDSFTWGNFEKRNFKEKNGLYYEINPALPVITKIERR
jgi:hypothetical protein